MNIDQVPLAIQQSKIPSFMAFLEGEKQKEIQSLVDGRTVVLSLFGPVAHRYGAFATEKIADVLRSIQNSKLCDRVILEVDSGGGYITGVKELSDLIFSMRGSLEVIAYVNELAASAAYWIASAASKVILASQTANVGSIGIIEVYVDASEMEKNQGIKITEIYAGKYKTAGSQHKHLDADAKEVLQAEVDEVYSIFVADVARNRGMSVEDVLKVADGRIYMGENAMKNGLVDIVRGLVAEEKTDPEKKKENEEMAEDEEEMTEEEKENQKKEKEAAESEEKEKKPDEEKKEAWLKKGIISERKRIAGIGEYCLDGQEKLAEKAIRDGWSVESFVLAQMKSLKSEQRGHTMADIQRGSSFVSASLSRSTAEGKDPESEAAELDAFVKSAVAAANKK